MDYIFDCQKRLLKAMCQSESAYKIAWWNGTLEGVSMTAFTVNGFNVHILPCSYMYINLSKLDKKPGELVHLLGSEYECKDVSRTGIFKQDKAVGRLCEVLKTVDGKDILLDTKYLKEYPVDVRFQATSINSPVRIIDEKLGLIGLICPIHQAK